MNFNGGSNFRLLDIINMYVVSKAIFIPAYCSKMQLTFPNVWIPNVPKSLNYALLIFYPNYVDLDLIYRLISLQMKDAFLIHIRYCIIFKTFVPSCINVYGLQYMVNYINDFVWARLLNLWFQSVIVMKYLQFFLKKNYILFVSSWRVLYDKYIKKFKIFKKFMSLFIPIIRFINLEKKE